VRIDDDGVGFDLDKTPRGLGLRGMRERAVLAGGRLVLLSVPGEGTLVEARLRPVAETPEGEVAADTAVAVAA
jgi:signal transduction histidine kinase